jgi:uncharacterized protein YjbI with pentapeptide repeats
MEIYIFNFVIDSSYSNVEDIIFNNCEYENINSTNNGGAIYISIKLNFSFFFFIILDFTNVNISNITFSNCIFHNTSANGSSNSYGGAIRLCINKIKIFILFYIYLF